MSAHSYDARPSAGASGSWSKCTLRITRWTNASVRRFEVPMLDHPTAAREVADRFAPPTYDSSIYFSKLANRHGTAARRVVSERLVARPVRAAGPRVRYRNGIYPRVI